MTKVEEIFNKTLNEQLSFYLRQRKSYGQYLPNLEFKRIIALDFRKFFKPWEEFPIPASFQIEFYVSADFNDMRQGLNPHRYSFLFLKVLVFFETDHFSFDFSESELIDSTIYPN